MDNSARNVAAGREGAAAGSPDQDGSDEQMFGAKHKSVGGAKRLKPSEASRYWQETTGRIQGMTRRTKNILYWTWWILTFNLSAIVMHLERRHRWRHRR